MHRIDAADHLANLFTNGSPQSGQGATVVDADWLNAVQENIVDVILFAGIALAKGDHTQLRDAIMALIAGGVGTGGGAVPTTRQVTGTGMFAGQGGPLAADLTFGLPAASTAEVSAQAINTKIVTPASLAGLISLTVSGGTTILRIGPAILQMVKTSITANSTLNVSLPTTFPTACLGAWVNGGRTDYGEEENAAFVSGEGASLVTLFNTMNHGYPVTVFAIGY